MKPQCPLATCVLADPDPGGVRSSPPPPSHAPHARVICRHLRLARPSRQTQAPGAAVQVKDGSWVMRQAVGTTPVIIGNKLRTTYHRGERHLEVTIDISSNSTAAGITNYVAGSVSSLAIWLGFVLEGKRSEHLPERLLGAAPAPPTPPTPRSSAPLPASPYP